MIIVAKQKLANKKKKSVDKGISTFFTAETVAVVGASNNKGKVGYDVVNNLAQFDFPGKIVPINPKEQEVQGLKSYKSLLDYSGPIDLVFIAIPAEFVINVIEDMGKLGIGYVVIITAGFKEIGAKGAKLENQLGAKLKEYGIRAIGPNCLGILDSHTPLNGSFASRMSIKGNLGFISQSGALITGILDWSLNEELGFSRFISVGNKLDIDEVELIEEFGNDPQTTAILAYVEAINKGKEFIKVCQKVTQEKPIIIIKSGSSKAGARAASSHTGSMAGANTAYSAAFEKAGVIRANSIQDLFDTATAFSSQPLPVSPKLCIITNAGGPGIIATDYAEFSGLELASLSLETIENLQKELPPAASAYNPVDVLGTGTSKEYEIALNYVLPDENVGMVLLIITPQGMTEPVKTAQILIDFHKQYPSKPVAAAYMGGVDLAKGSKLLKENGIPCFSFPERAVTSLTGLWSYVKIKDSQKALLDKPRQFEVDKNRVEEILELVVNKGRVTLLGSEAIAVAEAYGITSPKTNTAFSLNEALKYADEIGYPLVMKITSPDLIHKSDFGGVAIGIKDGEELKTKFTTMMQNARKYSPQSNVIGMDIQALSKVGRELILGASVDPQWGHLIMIGSGGIYANYQKDISFGLAPLNGYEASRMLEKTRIHKIMQGVRGEDPDDIQTTKETLQRLSQLVTDFPEILELDINPLFVFKDGINAVDVKITISKDLAMRRFTQ
ncbi:MAG: Succinyl-CoA ligase [ADP-forming] subunit alpha [Candidatus Heimdallarchaeota archaeon LC_2]|nr:MAG: Succinyl-CoA ligase [ADP-forming] subunit alpha [Candidatus Heimdallarchaeota archaeon LC_2]